MRYYLGVAREKGFTEEHTGTVLSLVMAVSACSILHRKETGSIPDVQKKKFSDFFESAKQNDVLDARTTLLIQIAAALANGCPT
ncbi:MAG: carboxymuconolactone decarboxylase family protein [candidate division WOR-3 bacterium]|nr:MAG: carboxymuconolactone decarboxylase family protein [candidate division WOR-3 bacterium]